MNTPAIPVGGIVLIVFGDQVDAPRYVTSIDSSFGLQNHINGLQAEAVARGMCVTITIALTALEVYASVEDDQATIS